MLEGLDGAARQAVENAVGQAHELGHSYVGTEHLLLGLLAGRDGAAVAALRRAGATPEGALAKVVEAVGRAEPVPPTVELGFTARGSRAIERASRFSLQRRSPHVDPGDLLLGVLDVEGTAGQVLRGLGVDVTALRTAAQGLVTGAPPASSSSSGAQAVAGSTAPTGPRCAGCGAELEGSLAHRPLASDGPGERRQVVVVYSAACGATIGVLAR